MEAEIALGLVALAALLFFSTIESAYESLSEVSLRVMAYEREERPAVRFFRELLENRQRFELILILGTQLSIVAIVIVLADLMATTGLRPKRLLTLTLALAAIILFRQAIPRLLAQNYPEEVLWRLLPAFKVVYRIFSVPIAPLIALLRKMRRPEPKQEEEEDKEIQAFIDVGEEEGIIEESEGELIQSIVEFSDTRVSEIMRPRTQVVAIEASSTIADARRLIIESKYSRLPVYRGQIDNVEGIIHVRDVLARCDPNSLSASVTECMRPAYFVPESKPIAELLEEMQKAKVQMAIVIDEYGGMAGLVTIEDIVEEIVGEIEDEDRAPPETELIQRTEDGSYLIDGSVEIKKVEMLFDREIEADDFTTVAGLILNEMGRVPSVGEKLEFKGIEFEVVQADSRRVNRVRMRQIVDKPEWQK